MKWHFAIPKKHAALLPVFLAVVIVASIVFYLWFPFMYLKTTELYEHIAYALHPSAQLAYAYGKGHLDARNPRLYDINESEHFFNLAADIDPTLPNLYHELARIAFLKGNFTLAMTRINFQINQHGDLDPSAYYVRGLVEGYMGLYDASADDYAHFLKFDPYNWAALNDYAWVLLKAKRYKEAAAATEKGLEKFPANAWLLNSNTIALYEMGDIKDAKVQAKKAMDASKNLSIEAWLHAYPGNDPKIAAAGVDAFKKATEANMHSILSSTSTHALQ
jgi:tetratricopeptide (TPR) repeat protein